MVLALGGTIALFGPRPTMQDPTSEVIRAAFMRIFVPLILLCQASCHPDGALRIHLALLVEGVRGHAPCS